MINRIVNRDEYEYTVSIISNYMYMYLSNRITRPALQRLWYYMYVHPEMGDGGGWVWDGEVFDGIWGGKDLGSVRNWGGMGIGDGDWWLVVEG